MKKKCHDPKTGREEGKKERKGEKRDEDGREEEEGKEREKRMRKSFLGEDYSFESTLTFPVICKRPSCGCFVAQAKVVQSTCCGFSHL